MKRKILTFILLFIMITTTVYANEMLDIQSHWGKSNIEYLIGRGSINGYPDGTFRPDGTITRAEFVKIALGS
ncbi:MAG: S-layer homology domain-containing protein, partial [Sedimentibacter sp.]|uniref:S-layer homology domain-containing protein n=1 Tax=Sedimentibacter sp. TaxID=1960295 RepID=UPI0029812647